MLILSVLIGLTLDLTGAKPAVKYYATKYDHIDVEAILNNRRMVNYYAACLLSNGPCPPEGVELKRILPEALQTNCGRCTEKQASVALRAIKRLKKEYPKIWSQLAEKWDPDDVYVRKFESTFGTKIGPSKPVQEHSIVLNRDGDGGDENSTSNQIDEDASLTTTASQLNQTSDTTIINAITSTNRIPSSTSLSTTESPPSSSTSTTRFRIEPIPGLLPINTFFTNPPIPIRPIVNINIGANIGATVKAIKQVERAVAGVALEKLGMLKRVLTPPWRRTKWKHS